MCSSYSCVLCESILLRLHLRPIFSHPPKPFLGVPHLQAGDPTHCPGLSYPALPNLHEEHLVIWPP